MVAINLAYTSPINEATGPKSSPVLTIPQVWAGLQRKVRAGQEFVPVIISTDVIEERTDPKKGTPIVVREVVFKDGAGPPWAKDGRVREECWSYDGCKVDFFQPDGSTITNTISAGPKGVEEGDLVMTYTFEWLHPEIDNEDHEAVKTMKSKHTKTAQMAVEKSIESIRRMVVDGTIKA